MTYQNNMHQVLSELEAADGFRSGAEIAEKLNISRNAVWKHIQGLRQSGYDIEAGPRHGYRLVARPDVPRPEEVQPLLRTRSMGWPLVYYPYTESTNATAAQLAGDKAPEGTVVTADTQTNGRGRYDRSWFSPPGTSLYFSLLLRPQAEPQVIAQLPLVAGIALTETVHEKVPDVRAGLKWPNDLLVNRKKAAGILCEMNSELDRTHHVIIGIGLNVNNNPDNFPAAIRDHATSLAHEHSKTLKRKELLAGFLNRFDIMYEQWCEHGFGQFRERWEQHCTHLHTRITVCSHHKRIDGNATGLDNNGALLVRTDAGETVPVYSGDITNTDVAPA